MDELPTYDPFTLYAVSIAQENIDTGWRVLRTRIQDGAIAEVLIEPTGEVIAQLILTDDTRIVQQFQSVIIKPPVLLITALRWNRQNFDIFINSLSPLGEPQESPRAIGPEPVTDTRRSVERSDAPTLLAPVIAERQSFFATKKRFASDRVMKSYDEQLQEFEARISRLKILFEEPAPAADLSAYLRGLVTRPNNGPNWDPILYRFANMRSLPLPVYAHPGEIPNPTSILIRMNGISYDNALVSINPFPGAVLMDLATFMSEVPYNAVNPDAKRSVSLADLLLQYSSSSGVPHSDDSKSHAVHLAQQPPPWGEEPWIEELISRLAGVVVQLGEWVLCQHGLTSYCN